MERTEAIESTKVPKSAFGAQKKAAGAKAPATFPLEWK
jgi:hypothetical protein